MNKIKISKELIVQIAIELIDISGSDGLSLNEVARRLEIKPPSLYKHIKNIAEIKREIFLFINNQITIEITKKIKKGDKNPILKYCQIQRSFAKKYPNRYLFISSDIVKDKNEFPDSMILLRDFIAELIEHKNKNSPKEIRYQARAIRSLVHGFIMYELNGGWSQIVEIDKSFNKSIGYLTKLG